MVPRGNEPSWEQKWCHLGTDRLLPKVIIYHPAQFVISAAIGSEQKYFFFLINDRIIPICYILSSIHNTMNVEWMWNGMNVLYYDL